MEEKVRDVFVDACRRGGICAEGMRRVCDAKDIAALIDYYVANPDWAMERDIPNLEVLRELSSEGAFDDSGIFVDLEFKGELLNDRQVYIFHHCSGNVKVALNQQKALIPMLYIGNGCRLRIVGVGQKESKSAAGIVVPVYSFGRNDISAKSNRWVTFKRYSTDML